MVSPKIKIIFAFSFLIVFSFPNSGLCESDFFNLASDLLLKELTTFSSNPSVQRSRSDCLQEYKKLYKNDTLRVSIFLGVLDTDSGNSWDPPARHSLIDYLTMECQPDHYACGFSQKSTEPTVLQKTTTDSKNIIINIYDSSVSSSLNTSNSELLSAQLKKSKHITNIFLQSLERDEIVFYIGHDRGGTGPGFYYLPLFSSQWLSALIRSPLLSDTISTLNQTSTPPKIFGFFCCNSERWYAKKIQSAAPDMALIVYSDVVRYSTVVVEAVDALNSIFGNLCYSEFENTSIKLTPKSEYKLYGLFENNKIPQFKGTNSLFSIAIFLVTLPILMLITSKIFPVPIFTPCKAKTYSKDIIFLIIFPIYSLIVTISLAKIVNNFDEHSIPFFLSLTGALLLFRFLYYQKNIFNNVIKTYRASIAFVLLSILIYFGMNLLPAEGKNELFISILKSVKFIAYFFFLLPFAIFSTGILKYPLFGKIRIHWIACIFLFITSSLIFYIIITYSAAYLSISLPPWRSMILAFFLYNQFISVLFYYYKRSTLLPIIYQTLALAFVFSENLHGLFF